MSSAPMRNDGTYDLTEPERLAQGALYRSIVACPPPAVPLCGYLVCAIDGKQIHIVARRVDQQAHHVCHARGLLPNLIGARTGGRVLTYDGTLRFWFAAHWQAVTLLDIRPNEVDVAARQGHVPLRGSGRGARHWAHNATGIVNLRAVEAEGNGDLAARSNVSSAADGRTSVAESRRLYLTVKSATVIVVIKVDDALGRASAGQCASPSVAARAPCGRPSASRRVLRGGRRRAALAAPLHAAPVVCSSRPPRRRIRCGGAALGRRPSAAVACALCVVRVVAIGGARLLQAAVGESSRPLGQSTSRCSRGAAACGAARALLAFTVPLHPCGGMVLGPRSSAAAARALCAVRVVVIGGARLLQAAVGESSRPLGPSPSRCSRGAATSGGARALLALTAPLHPCGGVVLGHRSSAAAAPRWSDTEWKWKPKPPPVHVNHTSG